jgi:hypothetical protein
MRFTLSGILKKIHGFDGFGGDNMSIGLVIIMALLVLNILGMCVLWYQMDVLERIRSSQGACGDSRAINEGPMKKGGINPGPKGPKPPYKPPSQRIRRRDR